MFTRTPAQLTAYTFERLGCTLHYWMGGPEDRPLVVMMHGATMDHRMFNAQVEALVDEYRVLTWDARGHGRSKPVGTDITLEVMADDMFAILDEHSIKRVVALGQSMGGYIAQQMHMQSSDRLLAMIIIGSTPMIQAYSALEVMALKATLPMFRVWPYKNLTQLVARSTAVTDPVREYALEAMRMLTQEDFTAVWRSITVALDDPQPDYRFELPMLLTHGDRDRTGTIKRDMQPWAKREPQAEFHIIPNAGHNANQDNPAFTNRIIRDFLRERVPLD